MEGPAFVSYSYRDKAALTALKNLASGCRLELTPFEPIAVPPSRKVSNELLSAIDAARSVIFIDTENARRSRWVSLETDHARRKGKPVLAFRGGRLIPDTSKVLDLAVFPSFSQRDGGHVLEILRFMRRERSFDVFIDREDVRPGSDIAAEIQQSLQDRLERGGYALMFWSRNAAASEWVRSECGQAMRQFPDQVLPVLLDDTPLPPEMMRLVADIQEWPLRIRRISASEFDQRDVDDVIVWLYWLIQRHRDEP